MILAELNEETTAAGTRFERASNLGTNGLRDDDKLFYHYKSLTPILFPSCKNLSCCDRKRHMPTGSCMSICINLNSFRAKFNGA